MICTLSKVVGISATATFKTVLGNYDIDYLEWKLGDNYFKPTAEDKERLKKDFENQTSGFEKVEIVVDLTETSSKDVPNWLSIYANEEVASFAHNKSSYNNDIYKEVRYYKAVLAFKHFLDNNLQSYLALFSKALKKNDGDFDQNTLFELYKLLSAEKGVPFEESICAVLDSNNFDEQKKELIDALSEGKRRFIISTYATIGAGQNLQYSIPANRQNEVIKINNTRENKSEMDIEGIYLDKPTLLVYQCDGEEETAINRVFQMEYLFQKKAISYNDKMREIVLSYNSINKSNEGVKFWNKSFSNLRDVKIFATKTIVQAMGRKCRTSYRGKKVYILADSELGDALDKSTLFSEDRMFNQEMVALANKFELNEDTVPNEYMEDAINMSISSNKRILQLLTRCFENRWSDEEIRKWKTMREYTLQHPTLTKEEWSKSPFKLHYISFGEPIRKYYYQQNSDYYSINQIAKDRFENANEVSSEDANLKNLFETWPRIKELFIKHNYAIDFKEGDYILSPPLYNNIYKGALGEVCGKEIFEYFDIPLEELNAEEHELFDFKVKGKPIYVDFKYWKDTTQFDAKEYHNKVAEKANGCKDVKTIIIANVRDTGFEEPITTKISNINIIELSLICNAKLSQKAAKKIQELKNE